MTITKKQNLRITTSPGIFYQTGARSRPCEYRKKGKILAFQRHS